MNHDDLMKLELLAPAKNADIAIDAINCGADAVYIGGPAFGARQMAGNSLDDIKRVIDYAHLFNVKVYITLNTIIKNDELKDVENLIYKLYDLKVDALIIQDMGILEMDIPPIELHASTQCDIRTPEKAIFLENCGFSQLVLARELTAFEIKLIHDSVKIPLEAFIHGALCVCYSGRCYASEFFKGRSANRGECAQICRLPYNLYDGNGNLILENKHLLSLKDFCQYDNIGNLIKCGVTSFKIEGRLKDASYVRTVVSKYRERLDEFISKNSDRYKRSSCGISHIKFQPDFNKIFHRNFTTYFFNSRKNVSSLSTLNTPKSVGEYIGTVKKSTGNKILIDSDLEVSNGDGLSFYNDERNFEGFRVNKIIGNQIETLLPLNIQTNTKLYRTFDKKYEDSLSSLKDVRTLPISLILKIKNDNLYLEGNDCLGNQASLRLNCSAVIANNSQSQIQRRILSKLGNTHYCINSLETLDDIFIPASVLTEARRYIISVLQNKQIENYLPRLRKKVVTEKLNYTIDNLTYRDNIANYLAENFYKSHGARHIEPALEITKNTDRNNVDELMTTRYCIRRELGYCKINNKGKNLTEPLILKNGTVRLLLDFDCNKCEMKVKKLKSLN